jgi:hypothetical protein
MLGHLNIVDLVFLFFFILFLFLFFFSHEPVRRPFLFIIEFCKAELANGMAVEGGLSLLDHRVIAVHSHGPVIVRYREGDDLDTKPAGVGGPWDVFYHLRKLSPD